ncbi:unnamed protein product, partial [Schistosoma bovis]
QHLRSGYDLAQCDRLVNSIKLYCPWEAAIRQAEVEQKRGNVSYTHDILRYIIDSVIARRDHDCGLLQQSANNNNKLLHSNELWSQTKPFSHIILPTFPEHTPVGGLCKLALIELRAHLALVSAYFYTIHELKSQHLRQITFFLICDNTLYLFRHKHYYKELPNRNAPHKSFDLCEGCDTARVLKPKQVVFLGDHTPRLQPKCLIQEATEKRQEMQSHGSR